SESRCARLPGFRTRSASCSTTGRRGRRRAGAAATIWSANTARTRCWASTCVRSRPWRNLFKPAPASPLRAEPVMRETPSLITIDAEGDDLWSRPRDITPRNAACLPRFQELCERYRWKPVYLANYEMALSPFFEEFGQDVLARGTAEIGMHLHAWNSPPL